MYTVVCDNPIVIYNRAATPYLSKYGWYDMHGLHHNGRYMSIKNMRRVHKFFSPYRFFKAGTNHFNDLPTIVKDNINNGVYHTVNDTGMSLPLYLVVGCGHCVLCKERKRVALSNKIRLHDTAFADLPYFVTLTYKDTFLPSCGVCRTDVQKFIKRLRNKFDTKLSYVYVSEYGTKTYRPHYHILVYGAPSASVHDRLAFYNAVRLSWCIDGRLKGANDIDLHSSDKSQFVTKYQLGRVDVRLVDNHIDKLANYISKYIRKPSRPPSGKSPCFYQTSYNLGLTSPFYDALCKYLKSGNYTTPFYIKSRSGNLEEYPICGYYLDKILPSMSRSTYKLRGAVNKCLDASLHFVPDAAVSAINNNVSLYPYTYIPTADDRLSVDGCIARNLTIIYNPDDLQSFATLDALRRKFVSSLQNYVDVKKRKIAVLEDINLFDKSRKL